MRSLRLSSMLLLFLIVATAGVYADTVKYIGPVTGESLGGYYISPYYLEINGVKQLAWCVDSAHHIPNNPWTANVTNSNSASFSNTYLKSQTTYQKIAWLIGMWNSVSTLQGRQDIQSAIWSFTGWTPTGNSDPLNLSGGYLWLNKADSNYGSGPTFKIYTDAALADQEFMQVPEPSSVILFGISLIAVAILARRFLA